MEKREVSTSKKGDASEEAKYSEESSDELTRSIKTLVKLLMKAEEVYQARIAAGLPGEVEPEEFIQKNPPKRKK